ncbi:MAG: PSD1 and planctomycete cytochrome C domain-containing protein [Planctomycetes bacterium]|nr:PSD1 and planctomycete cytochrome C domain-containing protein [Planctomycetota bacterium]
MRISVVITATAVIPVALLFSNPGGERRAEIDFLRQVKPILAEKCLECHGPDDPEADLRLDTADGAFADLGGYAAVVPGDRENSEIWYRITTDDEREQMPPVEHGRALTSEEVDVLGRWIDEGAPWQEHWGFSELRDITPPAVKDEDWVQDPIDRFVLARLEEIDLGPAAPIDDLGWFRRVSYDLIGLPPTREEIDSFLSLAGSQRREFAVDRLLDSPHFGEKWARHMLDLVRYAETRGHEFDYAIPNAFEYRDYLIRAYNEDVGWDDLIREHIAGDLLLDPRRNTEEGWNESIIGTGFWFLGEAVHSPVDLEVDLADRSANQLDVFGKTFLGLTIACARCHDHKFDPIPTRDYYSLAGFVQSASYRQVRFESLDHNQNIRKRIDALDQVAREKSLYRKARLRMEEAFSDLLAIADEIPLLAQEIDDSRAERIFADFEFGIPANWVVEGDAFTEGVWTQETRPRRYADPKPVGRGFVNSQLRIEDGAGADDATGRMLSPPFQIDRDVLVFRVGGGKNIEKVGVRLLIDGEPVLSVSGQDRTDMRAVAWQLDAWRDQTARIEIYDQSTDGWGHISCDDFRLQNRVNEGELAKKRAGDAGVALLAWVQNPLQEKLSDLPVDPFAAMLPLELDETRVDVLWQAGEAWWQDGSAWRQHGAGPVLSVEGQGVAAWLPYPSLVSDPDWQELERAHGTTDEVTQVNWKGSGRTVRTSTVELGEGPVWYLARGAGVAFSPVEHHRILSGPLHTRTAYRFDTQGRWQWLRHDEMSRYTGLRAHFEFSPTEGFVAIAAIVQGGDRPPTQLPIGRAVVDGLLHDPRLLPPRAMPDADELAYYQQRQSLLNERKLRARMAPGLLDGNGVDQRLLFRGSASAPRDPVPRAMLSRFSGEIVNEQGSDGRPTSGRAELADQMLESAGSLVARVAVNRVWHSLFGRGIAPQPDNFGVLAGYPTHPDLLDALAMDFRDGGWKLKPLLRRIVLSSTYGQSGRAEERALTLDPMNHRLHHLPPRRLTAEAVRDGILTVAGSLDRKMGGPSVPVHLTSFMKGRGRPGRTGPLDGAGRRTIYQEIRRNFLPPFLMIWDYPQPATTMGRRSSSNVPAQSLALMNDPFVREQADRWADRLLEAEDPISEIWWTALTRAPNPEERRAAEAYLAAIAGEQQLVHAPLAELAHIVMNLKEFVFLP